MLDVFQSCPILGRFMDTEYHTTYIYINPVDQKKISCKPIFRPLNVPRISVGNPPDIRSKNLTVISAHSRRGSLSNKWPLPSHPPSIYPNALLLFPELERILFYSFFISVCLCSIASSREVPLLIYGSDCEYVCLKTCRYYHIASFHCFPTDTSMTLF